MGSVPSHVSNHLLLPDRGGQVQRGARRWGDRSEQTGAQGIGLGAAGVETRAAGGLGQVPSVNQDGRAVAQARSKDDVLHISETLVAGRISRGQIAETSIRHKYIFVS
jgi:hypothetical protein